MRSRAILLASVAALAGLALAAGEPEVRPARSADLPGLWQMIDVSKSQEVEDEDSSLAPYQIYFFDRRGWMKYMTSAKPFRKSQLAMFDASPLVIRFEVDKNGVLALTNAAWDEPRKYQCNSVTKVEGGSDPRSARVGDIVLAATDAQGKPLWAKLLRKVPD